LLQISSSSCFYVLHDPSSVPYPFLSLLLPLCLYPDWISLFFLFFPSPFSDLDARRGAVGACIYREESHIFWRAPKRVFLLENLLGFFWRTTIIYSGKRQ
jgi:hypothetical protein